MRKLEEEIAVVTSFFMNVTLFGTTVKCNAHFLSNEGAVRLIQKYELFSSIFDRVYCLA